LRNPLRSEAEAYRFLIVSILAAAVIVVASVLGGPWAGVPVAVVTIGAVTWWYLRQPGPGRAGAGMPAHVGSEAERRILVVANETVGGQVLLDAIAARSEGVREHVLVVAPALNSPLRTWTSDEDGARAGARRRLDASLTRLRESGVHAHGEIGDGDPLQAIEDALRTFGAEEIIISTHPEGRSNWLEQGVVSGARKRFAVPVTHVVVDLEREGENEELRSSDAGPA
jgi:hypothetical protein